MDATSSTVSTASACASILSSRVQSVSYDCDSDTGHNFVSWSHWTTRLANDLPFICASAACKGVIDTARSVATSDCIVNAGSELFRDILNPVIRACAKLNRTSSKSANGEAPLMATWTTAETSPTTQAPSASTTDDPNDTGRTIAVVLGVLFIVLFVVALMSCACQETKSEKKPPRQQNRLARRDAEDVSPAPRLIRSLEPTTLLPGLDSLCLPSVQGRGSTPTPTRPSARPNDSWHNV